MVLFLLLFVFGTLVGICALASAWFLGRSRLAAVSVACLIVWTTVYLSAVGWFSHRSEGRSLGLQEELRLGGFLLDAHFLFSVDRVKQVDSLLSDRARKPEGIFYDVTVKYRSDALRAELHPPLVELTIIDARGRRFEPLEPLPDLPMLAPGESGSFDAVFDLPADVTDPRLILRSREPLDRWLGKITIDSEESLWHERTTFQLPAPSPRSAKGE